ncbi:MAG: acyltransferase family protein [Corynebacterium sp.]|uniref:acyltransferase family protein n=1 Tax=Corynebacterium sp. TaxID=1720 RepID=UPI003F9895A6
MEPTYTKVEPRRVPVLGGRRSPRRTHRRDIDGLRGLAIALVVIFHVFIGRVSAGVDVFLLIGGIFFFSPQIRNALNPKGLTLVQSFLRIFRRLYPGLVTVVAATLVLAVIIYAEVRWVDTGNDATASLAYFQNFHLASEGQEYSAINSDVSLYQHIWSMSVQMQIYVGSLIVIALLAMLFRKRSRLGTSIFHWLLVAATVASFVYATWLGGEDQATNYYSPLSRFWEIGLGGLFGIWLLGLVIPYSLRWIRWPAGLVGVALIIATGMFLDGAAQFPGPWTLVPLAGAMLVILAGNPTAEPDGDRVLAAAEGRTVGSVGVTRLLDGKVFQFLGRISYGLYLWHWPLLVLATYLFSEAGTAPVGDGLSGITATLGTSQGIIVGTAVIAVSLLLAWLTFRLVETPLRQKLKPSRSWVLGDRGYWRTGLQSRGKAVVTLVVALATVGVLSFGPLAEARNHRSNDVVDAGELVGDEYPGPTAFLEDAPVPAGVGIQPPAVWDRGVMFPQTSLDGCMAGVDREDLLLTKDGGRSDEPCVYGDTGSDRTMYLAGGSHSEHFLPALDLIGQERGIRVIPLVKMGCVLGVEIPRANGEPYEECYTWQDAAEEYILDNPPTDGVFMSATRPTTRQGEGPDHVPEGYVDVVDNFSRAGIHTWAVRDNPWRQTDGVRENSLTCLADGGSPEECGPDAAGLAPVNPALAAYAELDVTHIDLTPAYCRDGVCPAVVGNVTVYRDGDHFTPAWVELMAPEIERQMFDPAAEEEHHRAVGDAVGGPTELDVPLAPKDVFRLPRPGEGDPAPEDIDPGWVDPGYVDPGYVDPGYVDPGYVDPGYVDPGWVPVY